MPLIRLQRQQQLECEWNSRLNSKLWSR